MKRARRSEFLPTPAEAVPQQLPPQGVGALAVRTLKEELLWVRTFDTIEELRLVLLEFKERYNRDWLIERHGHRPPATMRAALTAAPRVAA